MAGRTVFPKQAGVNFRVSMAGDALGADLREVLRRVVTRTTDAGVPAGQREYLMIERLKLAMAGETIGAVFGDVLIDERRIDLAMARLARSEVEGITRRARLVTVAAGESLAVGEGAMSDQAVAGLLVREDDHRRGALIGLAAVMLDVA